MFKYIVIISILCAPLTASENPAKKIERFLTEKHLIIDSLPNEDQMGLQFLLGELNSQQGCLMSHLIDIDKLTFLLKLCNTKMPNLEPSTPPQAESVRSFTVQLEHVRNFIKEPIMLTPSKKVAWVRTFHTHTSLMKDGTEKAVRCIRKHLNSAERGELFESIKTENDKIRAAIAQKKSLLNALPTAFRPSVF